MAKTQVGYVKTYKQGKGYGFCLVHNLEGEEDYTSVFFHISEVSGLKGVREKEHVLRGKVSKTSKGWQMTDIQADYSPEAWERRPRRIQRVEKEKPFKSDQPKRQPPHLRRKNEEIDDTPISPHRKQDNQVDSEEEKEKERKGGYWKGDKYILD